MKPIIAAVALLAFFGFNSPPSSRPDPLELSFEQRVKAQEAIERVYYSHQLEATESFEKAVPRSVLEAKVTRYLKQSAALEQVWKTPVTGGMLDNEWKRIGENTRFPDRLREIYAALGNDPILIQECFVRPALVDRLARNFFQGDPVHQTRPREQAERILKALQRGGAPLEEGVPSVDFELRGPQYVGKDAPAHGSSRPQVDASVAADGENPARQVSQDELESWRHRLPARIGEALSEETATSILVRVVRESSEQRLRFTQYEIDKEAWEPWWGLNQQSFDPSSVRMAATPGVGLDLGGLSPKAASAPIMEATACLPSDTWDNASLGGPPLPRVGHSAVWTGSMMLVWGGSLSEALGSGERYDPLTDTWTVMSSTGAPTNRSRQRAVWTGTEMLLWGGQNSSGVKLNDGARYNPSTDTWSPMSASGLSGRTGHTAVWTGTEMIVFGGAQPPDGSRYNPATDSWTPITTPGWSAKFNHSAVWTGTRMIVWGGNEGSAATSTGAAYNPATNQWTAITNTGAPPPAQSHTAIWTGSRMIVWGGEADDQTSAVSTGGIYDLTTDSWIPTSSAGAPVPRANHAAVWTGTEMIVWGGRSFAGSQETRFNSGGRFNPNSNTWSGTSLSTAPDPIGEPSAVWTGDKMVIWGNRAGGRYDPASDAWTPVSFGNTPRPLTAPTAIWTGNLMIVWGGLSETQAVTNRGYRYDPLLDSWSPTSMLSAPAPRQKQAGVWTGSVMMVWGGLSGVDFLRSGGRYSPISNTWSGVALTNDSPSPRHSPSAVWTGSRVVIWGGRRPGGVTGVVLSTGALYDPEQDIWYPMTPATVFRSEHSAVWTGTEMIVWGGEEFPTDNFHNTGSRYNPSLDQWSPVSLTNGPSQRQFHTAQWTGSRMLIWGGRYFTELNTGAAYNPALDQWTPMSLSGAPAGRQNASSVWTGKEMIVWGGTTVFGIGMNTGGRYDPVTDQWSSTSLVGAPTARAAGHVTVWTGTHMIVWGVNVDAGRYLPDGNTTDADSDGYSVCQGDCADNNPAIHPGAAEVCDGVDNNCDGTRDEGFPDLDGDGYAACGGDCDDTDPNINPGKPEVCNNNRDDDCDGLVDEGFVDTDGDGYASCEGDCNDNNPDVHPGAPELCNGIDDDCNALVDDRDLDGDGFSACTNDCNDTNPAVHPGAAEVCNGVDDDCDGVRDEGFPDLDNDGFAGCGGDCNDTNPAVHPGAAETCNHRDDDCDGLVDEDFTDSDGDGYAGCAGDCNDNNPAVNPGAFDGCNGIDDNCNLVVDEGDADGDGTPSCTDCNDANPAIHPGAVEVCNGVDDNCDLQVDNLPDTDGDGFGQCDDCNDTDPDVWVSPFEVTALTLSASSQTTLTWDDQSWIGPETLYDVTSGSAGPATGIILASGGCLQAGDPMVGYADSRPDPPSRAAYWYLVRARNSCGNGTYGQTSVGQERTPPACP